MKSSFFASGVAVMALLALVGAGCSSAEPEPTETVEDVFTGNGSPAGSDPSANGGALEGDDDGITTFTLEQVEQHGTRDDCWMVIDETVYDVTDFIRRHPGGSVIVDGCGTDASTLFATQAGRGSHSQGARSQLASFEIGALQR